MVNSAIILAAGDGSRLKSSIPKVFHKIGGLSLIGHVLRAVRETFCSDIVVVLKPSYASSKIEFCDGVSIAVQETPKGTADAVNCGFQKLKEQSDGWCFILYGDIPLISPKTLRGMMAMQNGDASVVILVMDSSDAIGLGKLEPAEEEGTVKSIVEAKDVSEFDKVVPLCNAGLMVKTSLLRQFLPHIKPSKITSEYYITDIVKMAYSAGMKCRYYQADKSELSGVNTRGELAELEKLFQEKKRKQIMDNGVSMIAPETVFFSYDTVIDNDVTIYPYVYFSTGVHVRSGANIGPFCVIEGADVASAQIGPFSHLRAGTVISDGVRIGNFVEIKNSVIGKKSKVSHLSYIGDCEMGNDTNIGAGTITCNYDGFKKHKTQIGNNVFVGSNTAMVAPVKIEDGAIIGAGSVITKRVEKDSLALARGMQKNIPEYASNFREKRSK